jgi:spermidine synthase
MDITVVEIDGRIIELAEQYFELRQDDRFRVVQSDALKFIFQAAQKPDLYDLIIFDINGGVDGQPSPSPIFVSKDFLARLQKCLTKSGELIFHLINR